MEEEIESLKNGIYVKNFFLSKPAKILGLLRDLFWNFVFILFALKLVYFRLL